MKDLEWTTHRARQKRKHQKKLKENGNSSFDSFSITNSTNTGGPNGLDGNHENGVDTSMIEAFAQEDPHLFSSLVNLPTFVKTGEKVRKLFKLYFKNKLDTWHDPKNLLA